MSKRRVDLSVSARKKLIRCEVYLENISNEYTPASCLAMMKDVCEKRNKAIQGFEKEQAKYQIGDTYYEKNALKDIGMFMRCIKRKIKEKSVIEDYSALELYYSQQRNHFRKIRPIKKKTCSGSQLPGKTSFKQPGMYNGLPWILLCFDAASKFNDQTKPSTLYSYF